MRTTLEEYVLQYLTNHGMFDYDAKIVLTEYKNDNYELMNGRWNTGVNDYPPVLLASVLSGIDRIALDYIKKNMPDAWFRPEFEN